MLSFLLFCLLYQALVVLVHDMGPNWELVSDVINSTLQFKVGMCLFVNFDFVAVLAQHALFLLVKRYYIFISI